MSITQLQILRAGVQVATIELDENTVFDEVLMADKIITCNVIVGSPLPIQIDDYIVYNGEVYTINTLPGYDKENNITHKYSIRFEAPIFGLYREFITDEGETTFSYFGTAEDHLLLLISSMQEVDAEWEIGAVIATEPKFIEYDGDYCRSALTKIVEAFGIEFSLSGKTISLSQTVGATTGLSFEYGQLLGLHSFTRKAVDDSGVVNSVLGFGGSRNIDYTYRDGAKRLVFEERSVEVDTPYRKRRGRYVNEDIYPKRTGTITAVTALASEFFTITDPSLDFDINDYLLDNETAKVVFQTGELTGNQFEIVNYNHTTKIITLKQFKDTTDYVLPNGTFAAAIGDTYVLVDIRMPQSYIDAAEAELLEKTTEYAIANSVPKVAYDLDIDEKFIRDNGVTLNVGDSVNLIDTQLGVDSELRVTGLSYPLVNPAAIKATISNFVPYTLGQRLEALAERGQKDIQNIYRGNVEQARRVSGNMQVLRNSIFDSDGYFDGSNIKPNSIETLYLSAGAKSSNFALSEVVIKTNLAGVANSLEITSGKLIHYDIEIPSVGFIWIMTGGTFTGLTGTSLYYVYARCSRTTLTGTFIVSTSQIQTEGEVGFYHFKMGVLYPVKDGYRDFDFTKGMTYIVGDTITTGKVKSIDAQSYFDLTNNQFNLGPTGSGLDWNVTTPGTLTLRGALVQNSGGVTASIGIFRGAYSGAVTYYKNDTVTHDGRTWIYTNATATAGNTPAAGVYWSIYADKGATGAGVETEYSVDGATLWHTPAVTGDKYLRVRVGSGAWSIAFKMVGADGTSVNIKGSVASEANLPSVGNTDGDGYITADNGHLWIWTNGTTWIDAGLIQGPPGVNGQSAPRMLFAKNNDQDTPPTVASGDANPTGWTKETPATDDNIRLTDNAGDWIVTDGGDSITLGYDYEYVWMILENLDGSGDFVSWNAPVRISGRRGLEPDFTEFRFAKNGSPTIAPSVVVTNAIPSGWSVEQPDLGELEYLWQISTVKTGTGELVQNWSTPVRVTGKDGVDGTNGTNGERGPFVLGRGEWDETNEYYGGTDRVEVVKYEGTWYVTRSDAGFIGVGNLPTDTARWNNFGGEFESVATNLLFASLAYIENLGVRNVKTSETGQRIEIDGVTNSISIFNSSGVKTFYTDGSGNLVIVNADISGEITATSGNIGGFNIESSRLYSEIQPNGRGVEIVSGADPYLQFYNLSSGVRNNGAKISPSGLEVVKISTANSGIQSVLTNLKIDLTTPLITPSNYKINIVNIEQNSGSTLHSGNVKVMVSGGVKYLVLV